MTPEERLDRIEATLERSAALYEKMSLRQVGIRGLYREGVNRLEEMMDRMERQDGLLESLIDSQLRSEQKLLRLESTVHGAVAGMQAAVTGMQTAVAGLTATVERFIESQRKNGS